MNWEISEEEQRKRADLRMEIERMAKRLDKEHLMKATRTEYPKSDKKIEGLENYLNDLRKENLEKGKFITKQHLNIKAKFSIRNDRVDYYSSLSGWYGCQKILKEIINEGEKEISEMNILAKFETQIHDGLQRKERIVEKDCHILIERTKYMLDDQIVLDTQIDSLKNETILTNKILQTALSTCRNNSDLINDDISKINSIKTNLINQKESMASENDKARWKAATIRKEKETLTQINEMKKSEIEKLNKYSDEMHAKMGEIEEIVSMLKSIFITYTTFIKQDKLPRSHSPNSKPASTSYTKRKTVSLSPSSAFPVAYVSVGGPSSRAGSLSQLSSYSVSLGGPLPLISTSITAHFKALNQESAMLARKVQDMQQRLALKKHEASALAIIETQHSLSNNSIQSPVLLGQLVLDGESQAGGLFVVSRNVFAEERKKAGFIHEKFGGFSTMNIMGDPEQFLPYSASFPKTHKIEEVIIHFFLKFRELTNRLYKLIVTISNILGEKKREIARQYVNPIITLLAVIRRGSCVFANTGEDYTPRPILLDEDYSNPLLLGDTTPKIQSPGSSSSNSDEQDTNKKITKSSIYFNKNKRSVHKKKTSQMIKKTKNRVEIRKLDESMEVIDDIDEYNERVKILERIKLSSKIVKTFFPEDQRFTSMSLSSSNNPNDLIEWIFDQSKEICLSSFQRNMRRYIGLFRTLTDIFSIQSKISKRASIRTLSSSSIYRPYNKAMLERLKIDKVVKRGSEQDEENKYENKGNSQLDSFKESSNSANLLFQAELSLIDAEKNFNELLDKHLKRGIMKRYTGGIELVNKAKEQFKIVEKGMSNKKLSLDNFENANGYSYDTKEDSTTVIPSIEFTKVDEDILMRKQLQSRNKQKMNITGGMISKLSTLNKFEFNAQMSKYSDYKMRRFFKKDSDFQIKKFEHSPIRVFKTERKRNGSIYTSTPHISSRKKITRSISGLRIRKKHPSVSFKA